MLMKVNEHFRPFEIFLFPEKLRNGLETDIFPYTGWGGNIGRIFDSKIKYLNSKQNL
jgi:hypothetical protein